MASFLFFAEEGMTRIEPSMSVLVASMLVLIAFMHRVILEFLRFYRCVYAIETSILANAILRTFDRLCQNRRFWAQKGSFWAKKCNLY